MAKRAKLPLPRGEWLRCERVIGMHRRRPMTRFAREVLVKTLFLHTDNIFVAPPTDGRACEFDFFRNFPFYGRCTMQSGFDERGREDHISKDYYPSEDDGKDNCEPSYLLRNSFEHPAYLFSYTAI